MRHLFLFVVGLGLLALPTAYAQDPIDPDQNIDLLWQHADAQPDDFAAACMPLDNRAGTVLINPGTPFPLASVSKVLVLAEFARRVDAGLLTLSERVPLADLNRYDLPRTDRGAHDDFLESLPASMQSLTLWQVASDAMIRYSSNAASDYLLARMAPVDWDALYDALNMRPAPAPHPLGMIPLLMNNHETGQASLGDVEALSREQGVGFFRQFVNNPDWRAAEITYRIARRRSFPAWGTQAAVLQTHTATGTTYDYINMMAVVYGDGGKLSAGAKQLMREALRWTGYTRLDATYREYGSKLGFYSGGVLTLVAYGDPFNSGRVASVIFLRNVDRRLYYDLLRRDTIGDAAHWLHLNGCGVLAARR